LAQQAGITNRLLDGKGWSEHGNLLGATAVLAVTGAALYYLLAGGMLIGQDSATQFFPWYRYLGEQLRQGNIPEWLPYQFSGAPSAADPQSGWTYLPAMVVFTFLPLSLAVPIFIAGHLALAGLGTFGLARALGMPVVGATVAAVAYQLTGPVYGRSVCCPAAMEVAAWTPVALLGVQLAIIATAWAARLRGWAIAGLAISQALAAWLGQGAYYLLLAVAAFIAYRALIAPIDRGTPWRARFASALTHGLAISAIGAGLAAAGVLPRLAYIARSNLAGGEYEGAGAWAARVTGASPDSVFDRMLVPSLHFAGVSTLLLALIALVAARGRYATPFFIFLATAGITLVSPRTTPFHELLYLALPRFEELHTHWPERVSLVVYLAPALLAGSAVSILIERRDRLPMWPAALAAPLTLLGVLRAAGAGVPLEAFAAAGTIALPVALVLWSPRRFAPIVAPAVVAVMVAELLFAADSTAAMAPYGGFHRVDLGAHYSSSGAAEFLEAHVRDEPARYFGYDPSLRAYPDGQTVLYRYQFAEPETAAILVNNRGAVHGLDDIQGYNPVQPKRYVEFLIALNGHPQEYHDANVYSTGLDSPLLDLLNVRYIVVPADAGREHPGVGWLLDNFETVYLDGDVRVLENPEAFPRAWIVHEAVHVPGGAAASILAAGTIDPRKTALIEVPLPPMERTAVSAADSARVLERQPDRMVITTRSSAPGLLVLSETYDPGWRAYIDGERAPVLVANHVLRAVPLLAGEHEVELRYEAPWLRTGLAVSAGTAVALAILAIGWPWRPRRRISWSLLG
jgi:hypothetical protein